MPDWGDRRLLNNLFECPVPHGAVRSIPSNSEMVTPNYIYETAWMEIGLPAISVIAFSSQSSVRSVPPFVVRLVLRVSRNAAESYRV